jgi:ketosteroid isomerase-like protein
MELLAPLLTAFPAGDEWLTPDNVAAIQRLENGLREVALPDLECVMVGPDPHFAIESRGIQGFIDSWFDWLSPFDRWRLEIEEVIESGDRLVTLVRQFGTPRDSNAEVENAGAAVWFIRDARLARVEFHLNREAALRAAGLEP